MSSKFRMKNVNAVLLSNLLIAGRNILLGGTAPHIWKERRNFAFAAQSQTQNIHKLEY